MDRQRQGRRQSILKPPKADGPDEEDTKNFRRVRFSSNFVKEFAPGTEGDHVTVWDTTYEESISKSSLTSHSHVTLGNATLPETSNKENAASAALPLPATQPLPVCKGNNFYPEVKIKDPLLKCHETPCVIVPAFIKKQAERRANKALLSKQSSQISEIVHKNEHVQTMAHKLAENEAKDVVLKPDPFRIPAPKAVSRKSYFNSTTFNDGSFLGNTALSPIIGDKNETPMNQNDGVKRNIIGNLNKTQIFVANHDSACMDQTEVGFGKIIEPTSIPPDKIDNATETPCKTINFNHTIHNVDMEMTLETDFIESDAVQPTKTCKTINFNKTGVNLSGCELDMTLPPENHAPFVKRQTIMFQNVDMDTTCANIVPLEELNENEPDIVGNNAIKKQKKTRKTICFNKTGVDVSGADMEITVASENNELVYDDKQETIGKRKTIYYEDVCMEATCLDMLKVNEVGMNCEIVEETTFIDMDMEETNVVGKPVSEMVNSKSEPTQKTMNFNRTMNNADMELTMGAEVFKVPRVKQNLNQTLNVSAANMELAIAPETSQSHDNEKQKTVDQKTIVFQNADIDQTCMDITNNQQSSELNKSTLSINAESTKQQTTTTRRTVNFNQTGVEISGGDMEMTLPPEIHDPFVGNAGKQEKTGNRQTILFQNVDMDTTCANITPVEGSNEKKEDFADNGTEKQKKPRKTICFNRTGLDVSGVEMEMTQTSGKIESFIGNEKKPENIYRKTVNCNQTTNISVANMELTMAPESSQSQVSEKQKTVNQKTIVFQNADIDQTCMDTSTKQVETFNATTNTDNGSTILNLDKEPITNKQQSTKQPKTHRTVNFNQTGVEISGGDMEMTLPPEKHDPFVGNAVKQEKTGNRKTILFQNVDMDTTCANVTPVEGSNEKKENFADNGTEKQKKPRKTICFNKTGLDVSGVEMEMTQTSGKIESFNENEKKPENIDNRKTIMKSDVIESQPEKQLKTRKTVNFNQTTDISVANMELTMAPENSQSQVNEKQKTVDQKTIVFQNADIDQTCMDISTKQVETFHATTNTDNGSTILNLDKEPITINQQLSELNKSTLSINSESTQQQTTKTRRTVNFNQTGVEISGGDMEMTLPPEKHDPFVGNAVKQEKTGNRKTILFQNVDMDTTCANITSVEGSNEKKENFADNGIEQQKKTRKTICFNRTGLDVSGVEMEMTQTSGKIESINENEKKAENIDNRKTIMKSDVIESQPEKQLKTRKTVNFNQTTDISVANMELTMAPESSQSQVNEKQKTVDQKTIVFQNADIDQTCIDISTKQVEIETFNATTNTDKKHDPFVGNAVKQEKTGNRKTILFQNVDMDTTCANITPVEGSSEKKEDFADNGTEKQKKPRKTICFNRTGLDVSGVEMEMTQTSGKIESINENERKPENIDNRKTIPNQNTEMGAMCLDTPIAKDTKIEESIDDKSAQPIETRTVDFNQTGVAMSGVPITSTHCHTSLIKKTLPPENNEPLSQNVLKQKKTGQQGNRKTILFQNTDIDTTCADTSTMQIFDQNKSKFVDLSGVEMETIKTEETIKNNARQTVYDENFDMEETEVFVPEPLIDIQQNKEKTKKFVPYMDGDETIRKLSNWEQATKSTNLIGDTPYECEENIDKENKPQTIQCADFDREQTLAHKQNKHEIPIFDDKNQQNKAPLFEPYIDEPYMEETKLDIDQSKTNRRTLYDDNQINLEESQLYERTTFCHVLEDSACKIVDNSEIQRNNESFQNTDKHDVLEPSIIEIMDTSRPDLSIPQDNSDLEVNESVPVTPAKMGVKRDLAECTTPSVTSTKRLDDKGTPLALSKTSAKRLMQSPCSAVVPIKRIDNKQTPCKTVIEDKHLNRCEILEQEYLMLKRYCNDLDEEISEHEQPLPEAIESDLEWIVEDLEEISERFDVDIIREQVEVEEEQELMIRCHFDAIDMRMREIAADNERLLAEDLPVVVVAPTLVEKITEKAKSHSEYRILSIGDDSLCMLLRLEEYEITVSFDAESGCVAAFDIDEPRRANPNPFSKYTYHFYSHALDPQHICASIGQTFSILTLMDYFECQLYEFGETLMSVFYALIEFNARIDAEQMLTYKHLTPHLNATIAVNLKEHNMERVQVIATIHEGPVSEQKIQSIVDNTHRDRNFPRNIIAVLRGYLTSIEK